MKIKILLTFIILLAIFLRIFQLGKNPPALYWDEASLGYNAYTIATSLHDEHGEFLPLSRFIAFGDYKPPGYIYASVPSVLLFGLNEFSIRLPSMIAGVLMVLFTYLLTKELFKNNTIALLSGLFLALSPWALQFSRAAFEANLAACFNLLGIYLFIISIKKKWTILPSAIFFIFSFYTFNANRIIAPLIFFGLSILYWKSLLENKKWVLISLVITMMMILPSVKYLVDRESRLRFNEVSIFNNLETIKLSNQRMNTDKNSWVSSIIHNRRVLYTVDFLKHYFDNFSGRFLFTSGDVNPRLSIQEMGQLYIWDLPILLIGIYWLVRERKKASLVLTLWMLIVPIPAATARETPHALRILSILPTFQIIMAYGLYQIITWIKGKFALYFRYILLFVLCSLLSINFYYYLHNYYVHYPIQWGSSWQYGYKEMVSDVLNIQDNYDHVYITDALGRPYIYFAFYGKYQEDEFQRLRSADRDWFGFWTVSALGKIRFGLERLPATPGRILLVVTPGNLPDGYHVKSIIKDLSGREVFLIAEKL